MKLFISIISSLLFLLSFVGTSLSQSSKNDSITYDNMVTEARQLGSNDQDYEAIEKLLTALKFGEKKFGEKNKYLRNCYYYLSIQYRKVGSIDLAINYAKLAENTFFDFYGANNRLTALPYLLLGNIYRSKLNYTEALLYFNKQLSFYLNMEAQDENEIARANYSIAEIYYLLNDHKKAIQICENNITHSSGQDYGDYLNLLGVIYQDLDEFEKARIYFKQSMEFFIKQSDNEIDVTKEYMSFASLLINMGSFTEAQNYLQKAYEIIKEYESEFGRNISYYYRLMGKLYDNKVVESLYFNHSEKLQRKTNLETAISWYQKALSALNFPNQLNTTKIDSIFTLSNLECLNILGFIADNFQNIAVLFQHENQDILTKNIIQSIDYYTFIGDFINRLRKEITGDENKIQLSEIQESTFKEIIKTAYLAYTSTQNQKYLELEFVNAERIKSGSTFEKLVNEFAMEKSLIPTELIQKENKLNQQISNISQQKVNQELALKPDTETLKKLDSELFELGRERTEFIDSLEINFPEYYQSKYGDNSISTNEIQAKLKSDETFIEYTFYETDSTSELYTFIISPSTIYFTQEVLNDNFLKDLEKVFRFLTNKKYQYTKNTDAVQYATSAYRLYTKLIQPFENQFINSNLIIIPDGKLNYIPFDALLSELPDTIQNIQFNELPYLIKKYNINYSYSGNLLFSLSKKHKPKKNVLAFAPEYNNDSILVGKSYLKLSPLPGTKKEVESISKKMETKTFLGSNASVNNFLANYQDFDILHLATHAIINDSVPSLSQLAFSQNTGGHEKKELYTSDIYNLKINARLTVLSACNTGSGKLNKGEGVMSLARGFIYAGCPSIVMTLWEVEDNSGTDIMSLFYSYLKKGNKKDQALRKAKLEYLDQSNHRLAHPHFWLGYINIGDNSPVFQSYDFYFLGLLILIIIGISAEQIIRKRKRHLNLKLFSK